jgi:hypothetical protein
MTLKTLPIQESENCKFSEKTDMTNLPNDVEINKLGTFSALSRITSLLSVV